MTETRKSYMMNIPYRPFFWSVLLLKNVRHNSKIFSKLFQTFVSNSKSSQKIRLFRPVRMRLQIAIMVVLVNPNEYQVHFILFPQCEIVILSLFPKRYVTVGCSFEHDDEVRIDLRPN
jgi:hypothetical protein